MFKFVGNDITRKILLMSDDMYTVNSIVRVCKSWHDLLWLIIERVVKGIRIGETSDPPYRKYGSADIDDDNTDLELKFMSLYMCRYADYDNDFKTEYIHTELHRSRTSPDPLKLAYDRHNNQLNQVIADSLPDVTVRGPYISWNLFNVYGNIPVTTKSGKQFEIQTPLVEDCDPDAILTEQTNISECDLLERVINIFCNEVKNNGDIIYGKCNNENINAFLSCVGFRYFRDVRYLIVKHKQYKIRWFMRTGCVDVRKSDDSSYVPADADIKFARWFMLNYVLAPIRYQMKSLGVLGWQNIRLGVSHEKSLKQEFHDIL